MEMQETVLQITEESKDSEKHEAIKAKLEANNQKRLKALAEMKQAQADEKDQDEDWQVIDASFAKDFLELENLLTTAEAECKGQTKEKIDEWFSQIHQRYQDLIDFVNQYTHVIPKMVFGQYQTQLTAFQTAYTS